jgi:hypothetical protein
MIQECVLANMTATKYSDVNTVACRSRFAGIKQGEAAIGGRVQPVRPRGIVWGQGAGDGGVGEVCLIKWRWAGLLRGQDGSGESEQEIQIADDDLAGVLLHYKLLNIAWRDRACTGYVRSIESGNEPIKGAADEVTKHYPAVRGSRPAIGPLCCCLQPPPADWLRDTVCNTVRMGMSLSMSLSLSLSIC